MLRSVLVPLDGAPFSEAALPYARTLCHRTGATLHLAHVHVARPRDELLTFTQFQYEGVTLGEYDRHDQVEERHYLNELGERLNRQLHFPVEGAVLSGDVVPSLLCRAEEVNADLVVMSTHGRTGASRIWLGSVADQLVRSSPKPLLLVRPGDREEGDSTRLPALEHLLVPLDGTSESEGILDSARALAESHAASRFTLLAVVSSRVLVGAREYPLPVGRLEARMEKARTYLHSVGRSLEEAGFPVEVRVVGGAAPAVAILDTVSELEPDLVAMATHGHGGLARTVLGSVTDKVLRGLDVPLLVRKPAA